MLVANTIRLKNTSIVLIDPFDRRVSPSIVWIANPIGKVNPSMVWGDQLDRMGPGRQRFEIIEKWARAGHDGSSASIEAVSRR